MFRRKKTQNEINMTYFFGGTAVGMAAGLLFRTLFSHTSDENTVNCDAKVLINKNGNKHCQDDNFHKVHVERNIHNCHACSKCASRYEKKNYRGQGIPINQFYKDFEYNINNIDTNHIYDKDTQEKYYDYNNHTLYNISTEDNVNCNLPIKTLDHVDEVKKHNSYPLFKSENMEVSLNDKKSTKDNNMINDTNIKSINNNNETNTQKQIKSTYSIESIDTTNSLSIVFCENVTTYKNIQNINSSMTNPDIYPDSADNLSNMNTCNGSMHFNDTETLNLSFMEKLCKIDPISSTPKIY